MISFSPYFFLLFKFVFLTLLICVHAGVSTVNTGRRNAKEEVEEMKEIVERKEIAGRKKRKISDRRTEEKVEESFIFFSSKHFSFSWPVLFFLLIFFLLFSFLSLSFVLYLFVHIFSWLLKHISSKFFILFNLTFRFILCFLGWWRWWANSSLSTYTTLFSICFSVENERKMRRKERKMRRKERKMMEQLFSSSTSLPTPIFRQFKTFVQILDSEFGAKKRQ